MEKIARHPRGFLGGGFLCRKNGHKGKSSSPRIKKGLVDVLLSSYSSS